MRIAIVNIGSIISGDLNQPFAAGDTIISDGDRIVTVGTAPAKAVEDCDLVIDADGSTAIPGLIDSHVHITFGDFTPRQQTVGYLESYVHCGVTTAISASEVHVPGQPSGVCTAYAKFTALSADDWPTVGVAAWLQIEASQIAEARVAISAATERPVRVTATEAILTGAPPTAETFATAAAAAADTAETLADIRGSAAYKRDGHLSGLATGASWLCYFRALQLGPASKVAPVDKLSVVVAMALAALILREQLTWQHWLGGALIVAGTVVLARA